MYYILFYMNCEQKNKNSFRYIIRYIQNQFITMQANYPYHQRPPLWIYYELAPHQWKRPEHLNLCLETVQRHCGRHFRVIPLTRYNIYTYVPNLNKDVWYSCTHQQRMDIMKWELLSRYGGMVLDADVLVVRDLMPYMLQLKNHDFVAFGKERMNAPDVDTPSSTLPQTWAMASRPNGRLVTLANQRVQWLLMNRRRHIIEQPDIFGIGNLWECMTILAQASKPEQQWKYFHVDSECAETDAHKTPWSSERLLTNETLDERCVQSMRMVPLSSLRQNDNPTWFIHASREQLLGNANILVSKLWRWSLLDETPSIERDMYQIARGTPSVNMPQFYASGWVS